MDENLYYRSVNKDAAAPARRDQTHGLAPVGAIGGPEPAPATSPSSDATDAAVVQSFGGSGEETEATGGRGGQPPFLFATAGNLLSLSQKHNVGLALSSIAREDADLVSTSSSLSRNCQTCIPEKPPELVLTASVALASVWENERAWLSSEEISEKIFKAGLLATECAVAAALTRLCSR